MKDRGNEINKARIKKGRNDGEQEEGTEMRNTEKKGRKERTKEKNDRKEKWKECKKRKVEKNEPSEKEPDLHNDEGTLFHPGVKIPSIVIVV